MCRPRHSATVCALFLLITILATSVVGSATYGATTGAETKSERDALFDEYIRRALRTCGPINLAIEPLSPEAQKMGLAVADLESIVKSRLLAADVYDPETNHFLYVNINVVGYAFGLSLDFRRWIQDEMIGDRYATVWDTETVGTSGGSADYIKNGLRSRMDHFMVEFLTANNSDVCGEFR